MNPTSKPSQTSLFQVYLRLRPPISQQKDVQPDRCLIVNPPEHNHHHAGEDGQDAPLPAATHITLQPPADSRKRAMERFGFTRVFDEAASQLDVFQDTGMEDIIRGILLEGRDGLIATLGVTGSGKSHTILGSKSQRGLTQMSLDVIFKALEPTIKSPDNSIDPILLASVAASDPCEAQFFTAQTFLDAVYGDQNADRGRNSRAQTPIGSSRGNTPSMVRSLVPPKLMQATSPARTSAFGRLYPILPPVPTSPLRFSHRPSQSPDRGNSYNVPKESSIRLVPGSPSTSSYAHPRMVMDSLAKSGFQSLKDPMPALIFPRRQMPQRPSVLPRVPDVSHFAPELNPKSEYMVLVSMYEVYNDRIFDLLSPAIVPGQGSTMSRQGGNNQKDRRRPVMFKYTEGSADRKVVASLRKIACSTYEEALAVLDVGLTERKVTGTGANSVSSRSHGFFCLEVKRRMRHKITGEETWVGNTLTVADLAGSERARTAKTAGSTLAEAGKINESLMYLGQCLQMQGEIQDGKAALVPFRQCKLTELLFSNSFPSGNSSHHRAPQKAVMIVTADPLGDYNATSQILRYSALAKDVAVPRAPSAAESVFSATLRSSRGSDNGRSSPNPASNEELENALAEIARLTSENESFAVRLTEEEIARAELEVHLKASEERCLMIEQEVREECWAEMDEKMEEERKRWQSAWDDQTGRNDEHMDKKIELLSRGFQINEDPEPSSDEKHRDLEFENDQLRSKIIALERELNCRSPTKRPNTRNALKSSRNSNLLGRESDIESALRRMDQLKVTDNMFSPITSGASPGKRQRKMATRKWDLAPEDEI